MRLIPGKIKVQIELFKKVTLADIFVGAVVMLMILLTAISSLPGKLYICGVIVFLAAALLARVDTQPNYMYLLHILRHLGLAHHYGRIVDDELLVSKNDEEFEKKLLDEVFEETEGEEDQETEEIPKRERKEAGRHRHAMSDIIAFTDIRDNRIEYGGKYYGAAIEIPPVELRFFSPMRRQNTIESGLGRVLRTLNAEFSANIVKLDRPILYDRALDKEYDRLDSLKASYENALLTEEEYQARVEILYNRIHEVRSLCYDQKVIEPYYCLVLFESDKRQLENQVASAMKTLEAGEMEPHRLNTEELAVFLKYTNQIDFDEREIHRIKLEDYAQWAMPMTVDITSRGARINRIVTYTMRMVNYPSIVGDAWLAGVMSMPGTKCVVKCRPMERSKAIRGIDRSLQELRGQMMNTGIDSRRMELQTHIDTLSELLQTLQRDNESLLEVNVYVTAYDIAATRANTKLAQPPKSELPNITNMKRSIRRLYQESGFRLNNMQFDQTLAFIGSQVSGWDPMLKDSRGIPSNSLAACYPWIYSYIADEGGFKVGSSDGVPVFIDFFRRDSERVNSNMVIVGKSGSGKSYATKSILENLAAEDCKIFILDPENEYAELARSLHGKFINVGNAQFGRLNPFQIITALDDDEEDSSTVSGSYATHLQFLEEFFRQIMPDCDRDAMEYLNNMVDRMYTDHGITAETELSRLRPEDYPVFDDLYDAVMQEFQQTDNEYIRSILRTLMNYIAKFSTGGRNANIWNGPSTITTDENFTVFNFQSLLANRNSTIANAQMLLVLKYIDNEIIKNRDYNLRYHLNRKVAVVIDEAHVFIDSKFPVALDFMFQLAKRIRKYNGMQIVITQNIKDFVGSEEIARKSTAIINACQYSMIFSLAPNDIQDLCRLYEKAGGINEREQEEITSAPRGQAFAILSPYSRTTFRIDVAPDAAAMFEEQDFRSRYFSGEDGAATWEDIVGESREKHLQKQIERWGDDYAAEAEAETRSYVTFTEITEEIVPEEETGAQKNVTLEELEPQKNVVLEELGMQKNVTLEEPGPQKNAVPEGNGFQKKAVFSEEADMPEGTKTSGGVHFQEEAEDLQSAAAAMPAAEQQAQIPVQVRTTEQLLAELLSRFSYDSMLQEIRRTVREEIEREMAAARQTETAAAAETSSANAECFSEAETEQVKAAGCTEAEAEQAGAEDFAEAADFVKMEESDGELQEELAEKPVEEAESFGEAMEESAQASMEEPLEEQIEESLEGLPEESSKEALEEPLGELSEEFAGEQIGELGAEFADEPMESERKEETEEFDWEADLGARLEAAAEQEAEAFRPEATDDSFAAFEPETRDDPFAAVEPEAADDQSAADEPEDEDSFDIMALLAQQAEQLQNMNPIDMMVIYDEDITEVTLEELSQYIKAQKN